MERKPLGMGSFFFKGDAVSNYRQNAMPDPTPLPTISQAETWNDGFMAGLAVGIITGAGLLALVLDFLGRL